MDREDGVPTGVVRIGLARNLWYDVMIDFIDSHVAHQLLPMGRFLNVAAPDRP